MHELDALVEAMAARAGELGLTVTKDPAHMLERRLPAEALAQPLAQDAVPVDIDPDYLPDILRAMTAGYHAVLLGWLGDTADPAAVQERLRRYHYQALIARSWLGAKGEDLQLFLVGPAGADAKPEWRRVAHQIERNERVCRKVVWLPPADGSIEASLAFFLSRTYLARPWKGGAARQEALDRMAHLFSTIADHEFSEDMARQWLALLEQEQVAREELAAALVAALEIQS